MNGEITYDASQFGVICKPSNTLRVLLDNEHYYHIVHWAPTMSNKHPRDIKKRLPRLEPLHVHISVYYDLETVNTVEPGAEVHVIPYANAWAIGDSQVEVVTTADPNPYLVLDRMLSSILQDFNHREIPISQAIPIGSKEKANTHVFYRMIAYNGSRFDHAILFLYLVCNGWHIVQAPSATGKLRSMCVHLGKRRLAGATIPQYAKAYLEIWDPCLYTCAPLSKVATDFGLRLSKGELNHEEVQAAYADGRLDEWLTQNHQRIVSYNRLDVEVLRELVNRMETALGKEIFKHHTIAGMCYKTWREMSIPGGKGKHMKDVALSVESYELDSVVRSAIIGGRVEGIVGDHTLPEGFKMFDVVSLYPTVMQKYSYPIGKEQVITNAETAGQCLANYDFIGLYWVEYDQSPMQTPHPILPVKKENGCLDWSWEGVRAAGPKHAILPDVTIRDLHAAGARINWSNPEGRRVVALYNQVPIYGIVWVRSVPGTLFNEYVEKYSNIKKEEDRKKAQGLPFNAALREMSKLMLNSLSGKMSQRNFTKQSKFWTKENALRNFIENNLDNEPTPFIVSKNAAFTVSKKTPEQSYKNSHPSQIGVFIYAYARSYMWHLFFSRMKVWYSDTDSAIISSNDVRLLAERLIVTRNNKQFGMLEEETAPSRVIVIAPKTYLLLKNVTNKPSEFSANGGKQVVLDELLLWLVEKVRMKGVRDSDKWETPNRETTPINSDYLRFYKHFLIHQTVTVHTWTFRNVVREGRLERRELIKILKPTGGKNEDQEGSVSIL